MAIKKNSRLRPSGCLAKLSYRGFLQLTGIHVVVVVIQGEGYCDRSGNCRQADGRGQQPAKSFAQNSMAVTVTVTVTAMTATVLAIRVLVVGTCYTGAAVLVMLTNVSGLSVASAAVMVTTANGTGERFDRTNDRMPNVMAGVWWGRVMCPDPVVYHLTRVLDGAGATFEVMHDKPAFDVRCCPANFGSRLKDLHGDVRVNLTFDVGDHAVQ
jgi:hypothetical protein